MNIQKKAFRMPSLRATPGKLVTGKEQSRKEANLAISLVRIESWSLGEHRRPSSDTETLTGHPGVELCSRVGGLWPTPLLKFLKICIIILTF